MYEKEASKERLSLQAQTVNSVGRGNNNSNNGNNRQVSFRDSFDSFGGSSKKLPFRDFLKENPASEVHKRLQGAHLGIQVI